MKKRLAPLSVICAMFLLQVACDSPKPKEEKIEAAEEPVVTAYSYSVSVSAHTNTNAPALQSFAHGVSGDDILLFAGRTNRDADEGGLHNMDNASNYAQSSFIPKSFNTDIYVYNVANQEVHSISYEVLLDHLVNNYCQSIDTEEDVVKDCKQFFTDNLSTLFRATNPISTQDGNTLYVLGGYGSVPGDPSAYYMTYNQIASINVPAMIKLIKEGPLALASNEWQGLLQIGMDETNTLVSTGAEMYKIGASIYLAGGHNFGDNQKYLDAVYPFTITSDVLPYKLNVTASNAISDVADPKAVDSDKTSKFRRRDGPVTAALFKDATGALAEGLSFYAGVFTPATTAWGTAIYVHPNLNGGYTIDDAYNQTQSIYACGDLTAYDATNSVVHTFLLGGIGTDTLHPMTGYGDSIAGLPLGFTNNGSHIQFDMNSMSSTNETMVDVFPAGQDKFYGAESTLIPTTDTAVHYVTANGDLTEVIDLEKSSYTNNSLVVGYIYGGIEAYQLNPGEHGSGYGPGLSAASNKIWKVTLTRTAK